MKLSEYEEGDEDDIEEEVDERGTKRTSSKSLVSNLIQSHQLGGSMYKQMIKSADFDLLKDKKAQLSSQKQNQLK